MKIFRRNDRRCDAPLPDGRGSGAARSVVACEEPSRDRQGAVHALDGEPWRGRLQPARSGVMCALLLLLAALPALAADVPFWIEPCTSMKSACVAGDMDLARWALQAWEKASGGELRVIETTNRASALIRVVWAEKDSGLYGEAVPIVVNGRRGRELHIQIMQTEGDDPLLRDAIVYLTCLHESGHALGLEHTRVFADIMYSFQYGGDITEYFGRYRRKLSGRSDIQQNSGMSSADRGALVESVTKGVPR